MLIITPFIFTCLLSCIYAQDRKITTAVINPNIQSNDTSVTLVYIRTDSATDSVHQIWDFTQGIPTTIFAVTNLNTSLYVEWDDHHPSVLFTETPKYSFAAAIDKIYEYDDKSDAGAMEEKSPRREYETRYLAWRRVRAELGHDGALLEMEADKYRTDKGWRAGIFTVRLQLWPYTSYADQLPHLMHTSNCTQVDVRAANVTLSPDYRSARLALHLLLASTDPSADTMHLATRKSLDDEHTPGIFEIVELKTPESYKSGDGGFLQFRPVAYKLEERGVATSTLAHVSRLNRTSLPGRSTLARYFTEDPLVQGFVVAFGEAGDGYYRRTNYTAWSFTAGYGLPPVEGFSLFVILVIAIGLGVPVLLALSGIVYVLVRRYKQKNTPSRLTNED